jgi:CHAT domain-containing protein
MVVVAAFVAISACQTSAQRNELPNVEEAQRAVAGFKTNRFIPPPRVIDDVIERLDRQLGQTSKEREQLLIQADLQIPADATPHTRVTALYARANAARHLGRNGQELADLRTTVAIVEAWDDSTNLPLQVSFRKSIFRDAAWAEYSDGNFERSVELFERAAALAEDQGGDGVDYGNWKSLSGLAYVTAMSGDLEGARTEAKRARDAMEDAAYVSRTGYFRGDFLNPWLDIYAAAIDYSILQALGRWSDAEPLIRQSIAVFDTEIASTGYSAYRHGREVEWLSEQRSELARNLIMQGRLVEAEVVARRALADSLARRGTNAKSTAILSSRLVDLLLAQGRFAEAERLALRVIQIYDALETPRSSRILGSASLQLGQSIALQGRWSDAIVVYATVGTNFEENRSTYERYLKDDPTAMLTRMKAGRADSLFPDILEIYRDQHERKGADHYDVLEYQALVATAYAGAGERSLALNLYRESVPRLIQFEAQSRALIDYSENRRERLNHILESYLDLLVAWLESEGNAPGFAILEEAFAVASYLQSGRVQTAIARSAARGVENSSELLELIESEQDARQQLDATRSLLARALSQPARSRSELVIEDLRQRVSELDKSHRALKVEIVEQFPDFEALVNPALVSIAEATELLGKHEALISFYVGANRTYVWGLRKGRAPAFAVVDESKIELENRIRSLRGALEPDVTVIGDVPPFDVRLSHALFSLLVEPVQSSWQHAQDIIVVPHGPLGYLPMSLLVVDDGALGEDRAVLFDRYRNVAWFGRQYALSRVPSVASLKAQRLAVAGEAPERAFVGFGDPVFNKSQRVGSDTLRGGSTAIRGVRIASSQLPLELRNQPRTWTARSADMSALPPLFETREELLAISKALAAEPDRDVYLGLEASEREVKAAPLDKYSVVVFATHGLAAGDLDGLTEPALALSSPEVTGDPGDGLLTINEILGLRMNADWVVLSACNTAASDGQVAEAVSGLGRAFFHAGSRALLVSNWPVHSDATMVLTTKLFESRANGEARTRAEALQRAMHSLIDSEGFRDTNGTMLYSYAHPIFWAPFTLVGDGR